MGQIGLRRAVQSSWIYHKLLLVDTEDFFIPYDRVYPKREIPHSVRHLNVTRATLLHGARMTFRRNSIQAVRFDSILLFYAPFEDLDASYRVSRSGALVLALDASQLYHNSSAAGRMDRYKIARRPASPSYVQQRMGSARVYQADAAPGIRRTVEGLRCSALFVSAVSRGHDRLSRFLSSIRMTDFYIESWYADKQREIVLGESSRGS